MYPNFHVKSYFFLGIEVHRQHCLKEFPNLAMKEDGRRNGKNVSSFGNKEKSILTIFNLLSNIFQVHATKIRSAQFEFEINLQ